jgi:hypothetical protein
MRPPDTTNAYQYQEDTQKLMHPQWCTVAEDNWRTVGEDHWRIMPEDRWCIVARGVTGTTRLALEKLAASPLGNLQA